MAEDGEFDLKGTVERWVGSEEGLEEGKGEVGGVCGRFGVGEVMEALVKAGTSVERVKRVEGLRQVVEKLEEKETTGDSSGGRGKKWFVFGGMQAGVSSFGKVGGVEGGGSGVGRKYVFGKKPVSAPHSSSSSSSSSPPPSLHPSSHVGRRGGFSFGLRRKRGGEGGGGEGEGGLGRSEATQRHSHPPPPYPSPPGFDPTKPIVPLEGGFCLKKENNVEALVEALEKIARIEDEGKRRDLAERGWAERGILAWQDVFELFVWKKELYLRGKLEELMEKSVGKLQVVGKYTQKVDDPRPKLVPERTWIDATTVPPAPPIKAWKATSPATPYFFPPPGFDPAKPIVPLEGEFCLEKEKNVEGLVEALETIAEIKIERERRDFAERGWAERGILAWHDVFELFVWRREDSYSSRRKLVEVMEKSVGTLQVVGKYAQKVDDPRPKLVPERTWIAAEGERPVKGVYPVSPTPPFPSPPGFHPTRKLVPVERVNFGRAWNVQELTKKILKLGVEGIPRELAEKGWAERGILAWKDLLEYELAQGVGLNPSNLRRPEEELAYAAEVEYASPRLVPPQTWLLLPLSKLFMPERELGKSVALAVSSASMTPEVAVAQVGEDVGCEALWAVDEEVVKVMLEVVEKEDKERVKGLWEMLGEGGIGRSEALDAWCKEDKPWGVAGLRVVPQGAWQKVEEEGEGELQRKVMIAMARCAPRRVVLGLLARWVGSVGEVRVGEEVRGVVRDEEVVKVVMDWMKTSSLRHHRPKTPPDLRCIQAFFCQGTSPTDLPEACMALSAVSEALKGRVVWRCFDQALRVVERERLWLWDDEQNYLGVLPRRVEAISFFHVPYQIAELLPTHSLRLWRPPYPRQKASFAVRRVPLPSLQHLDLSGSEDLPSCFSSFLSSPGCLPSLCSWILPSVSPDKPNAASLLGSALSNPDCMLSLRSLDLYGWEVGPRGASVLSSVFSTPSSFPSLRFLNLESVRVGPAGATSMAVAFSVPGSLSSLRSLNLSRNELCDDGAIALASAFSTPGCLPSLHTLDLSFNEIGHRGGAAFASVFSTPGCLPHLSHLDLIGNNLGGGGEGSICTAFSVPCCLPCLRVLELSHLDSFDVVALATSLSTPGCLLRLETLCFGRTKLELDGASSLVTAFCTPGCLMSLLSLEVFTVEMTDDVASTLWSSLCTPGCLPSLQSLFLRYTKLGSDGASSLATALSTPGCLASLRVLDLRLTEMSPKVASSFFSGLSTDGRAPFLTSLNLYSCGIGLSGAIALAASISRGCFRSLQTLNLGSNSIEVEECAAVASAASLPDTLPALGSLDRSSFKMGSEGGDALTTALSILFSLPSIHNLDLSGNRWGPEGASALATSLSIRDCSSSLRSLYLNGSYIGKAGMIEIASALSKPGCLPSLHSLELRDANMKADDAIAVILILSAPGCLPLLRTIDLSRCSRLRDKLRNGEAPQIWKALSKPGSLPSLTSLKC